MGMKTSVVIAAYNECENIGPLTERLIRTLDAFTPGAWELIYIIEGTDATCSIAQSFAAARPEIRVFCGSEPSGLGAAFRRGFAAIAADAEVAVTMDADLNHQPEEIPELIAALVRNGADLVVGSRKAAGAVAEGTPPWKRLLSNTGNRIMRRLLRAPVDDQTSGFRVYRPEVLRAVTFTNNGFAFLPEILIGAHSLGFRIVEIPIRFIYRKQGQSKMRILPTALSYFSLFRRRGTVRQKAMPPVPGADRENWNRHWAARGQRSGPSAFALGSGIVRRVIFQPAVVHFLEKHFPPEGTFCEMGCGTGESSLRLVHGKRRFVGLDFSSEAISRAGATGHFHGLLCADVAYLPLRTGSIDGIWNLGVMEHFPLPILKRSLEEFRRVLKPGGIAVLFWPSENNSSRWVLGPLEWARTAITGKPFRFFPAEVSRLKSKQEAAAIIREAGFSPVEIDFSLRTALIHTVVVARKTAALINGSHGTVS
jgi:dolichol-phosphate mannosyltransferase